MTFDKHLNDVVVNDLLEIILIIFSYPVRDDFFSSP